MDHHHHHHAMDPHFSFGMMLIYSFGMSLHCASMCGPLLAAQFSLHQQSWWRKCSRMASYHVGRALSYTAAGGLCGAFGGTLVSFQNGLAHVGEFLTLCIGVALLAIAVQQYRPRILPSRDLLVDDTRFAKIVRTLRNYWRKLESLLWRSLSQGLRLLPHSLRDFALGFVTVLLPCMTLTPSLGMAMASGSFTQGSMLMFAFFLGTVPVMTLASFVPQLPVFWMKTFRTGILAFAGVVCILRAFGVHIWMPS